MKNSFFIFLIIFLICQIQIINAQTLSFTDVAIPLWIFYGNDPSRSVCWGDYDNDGDLDIYVVNTRFANNRLYRNEINDNNYLKIRLTDKNGNYNRYGSITKVYFSGTDSLVGMRMVDGGSGGRSQNAYNLHFGLDAAQAFDIEVMFTTRTDGQNHVFNKYNRPELSGVIPQNINHFLEIRDTVIMVTALPGGKNPAIITEFTLYQNYPNPFNSTTTIPFQINKPSLVKILIYDLNGKEVIKLVDKQFVNGLHKIKWDGNNQKGGETASGVYFIQVVFDNKIKNNLDKINAAGSFTSFPIITIPFNIM
jgi:hypothetical protein